MFKRFMYSFFIQMPMTVWFRWLSLIPNLFTKNQGIINKTNVSDAVLENAWKLAQQGLQSPYPASTSSSIMSPALPTTLNVQPKNLTVVAVDDVPISTLVKYILPAWSQKKDPSGAFLITGDNGFLGYDTVAGMTCPWTRPRVYGASSVMAAVCVYEFQNVIQSMLGKDISNR